MSVTSNPGATVGEGLKALDVKFRAGDMELRENLEKKWKSKLIIFKEKYKGYRQYWMHP